MIEEYIYDATGTSWGTVIEEKWLSNDSSVSMEGLVYNKMGGNPVSFVDPNGMSLGRGPSAEEREKINEGSN